MPPDHRKFVHDVAKVYRMDTQTVHQEPHRSVQLVRRFDTKVPKLLLSAALVASGPPPSLGKLADLRAGSGVGASAGPSWRAKTSPAPAPAATSSAPRAWGAANTHTPAATASTPAPVRVPAPIATATPIPALAPVPGTPVSVPEDWEDDA
ncbi:hypothetical protein B0H19DRAFT_1131102 [Mycena capillaripes]|nr:hypothetical protein B0H19DRAFT_1131102 [Mycena capillaripes]